MKYPSLSNTQQLKSLATVFGGLNVNLSCSDGEFYDMKNITLDDYPVLSTRKYRKYKKNAFNNLLGITGDGKVYIDKDSSNNIGLYIDGTKKTTTNVSFNSNKKQIIRMGAYVVIFPDKIWYNTKDNKYGYIEASKSIASGTSIKFEVTDADHSAITWHGESYYKENKPKDGDYMMVTKDGKSSLKVYYEALSMWSSVATTYLKITSTDIGKNFDEDDGLKITVDNSTAKWGEAEKVFLNKEDDGKLSMNTYIVKKADNYIVIPGIIKANKTLTNLPMELSRKCPDMDYVCEYQNRIWGCSSEKHEVYCCKQGDPKNFNYFKGVSLDSWAATVGSLGDFTGVFVFNQNPIFFKEDLMLRISVSQSGAHSYREVKCPGVGSSHDRSIALSDRVVYYCGTDGIYAYDGSIPQRISDNIGYDDRTNGVGFAIGPKYYLSSYNNTKKTNELLVFDSRNNLWAKEDNLSVDYFYGFDDEAAIVSGKDKILYRIPSTMTIETEKTLPWYVESGVIGYFDSEHKFISRINIRMMLDVGSYADFYIQYDSSGYWEHICNLSGKGTNSFTLPIKTKRCDHFRYKIVGSGSAKVFSISKIIEEGSDY